MVLFLMLQIAVQFGLGYGIANKSGQVSIDEIQNIFQYAKENALDTFNTAIGYGESELRLGQVGVSQWELVTKLPALLKSIKDVKKWKWLKHLLSVVLFEPKELVRLHKLLAICPEEKT